MKRIFGTIAATITAAAGIAVGPAGFAAAEPQLNGTYNFTWDTTQSKTAGEPGVDTWKWVVTPCGAGCAHVVAFDKDAGDMHLVNGRWEMTEENTLTGFNCPIPGRPSTTTTVTSLDAETLSGTRSNENHCVGMTIEGPASLAQA